MKPTGNKRVLRLTALSLAAWICVSSASAVDGEATGVPRRTNVSGNFDWTIVPANLGPYLIPGTDGDLYLRHLPLVGPFNFTANGTTVNAKIHVDLSGELDVTGTGVVWTPVTITSTVNGIKTMLFEGTAQGNEVALVATGTVSLQGRGPYSGSEMNFSFQEIGPGDSNTYTFTGTLSPSPKK
jgi:hypothetical protein